MFGASVKATNSSFQKGMTFCRSIYVKKVMKLLAFIFEQSSYIDKFQRSWLTFQPRSLILESHQYIQTVFSESSWPINSNFL